MVFFYTYEQIQIKSDDNKIQTGNSVIRAESSRLIANIIVSYNAIVIKYSFKNRKFEILEQIIVMLQKELENRLFKLSRFGGLCKNSSISLDKS